MSFLSKERQNLILNCEKIVVCFGELSFAKVDTGTWKSITNTCTKGTKFSLNDLDLLFLENKKYSFALFIAIKDNEEKPLFIVAIK